MPLVWKKSQHWLVNLKLSLPFLFETVNFRIHFSKPALCYKRSIKLKSLIYYLSAFMNTGVNPEYIFYNLWCIIVHNQQSSNANTMQISPKDAMTAFAICLLGQQPNFPLWCTFRTVHFWTTGRTLVQQWPVKFWSSQMWDINSHTFKTYWLKNSISDFLSTQFNIAGMKYSKYHSVFLETSTLHHWICVSST